MPSAVYNAKYIMHIINVIKRIKKFCKNCLTLTLRHSLHLHLSTIKEKMKTFTVKKLAEISGVSVRTLHYYDQIGLLRPTIRTEKLYRLYGNNELLRLQQILFFREMDFPLKDIIDILDEPGYNLSEALIHHRSALLKRKKRLSALIRTIDKTITNLIKGEVMKNPEELYNGFPEEIGTTCKKEAIERYGEAAIRQSEKELMKLGKPGFEALLQEAGAIYNELYELRNNDPEEDKVQQYIARHYEVIRKLWGTSHLADKQPCAYEGLGYLYVSDDRYLASVTNGKPQPGFAKFLQKGINHFVKNKLG